MVTISYRSWVLRVDPSATRSAYAAQPRPDWAACCDTCENFEAALNQRRVFPAQVLDLFNQLGIDPEKAAEQIEWSEARPGWHTYSVWYHVAGELMSGPDALTPLQSGGSEIVLQPISQEFRLGFSRTTDLVSKHFSGHPVVQVECRGEVPWLLSQPPYQRNPGQQ